MVPSRGVRGGVGMERPGSEETGGCSCLHLPATSPLSTVQASPAPPAGTHLPARQGPSPVAVPALP